MKYSQLCPYKTCPFCLTRLKRKSGFKKKYNFGKVIMFTCKSCHGITFWHREGQGDLLRVIMGVEELRINVNPLKQLTSILNTNEKVSDGWPDNVIYFDFVVDFDYSDAQAIKDKIKFLLTFQ